MFAICFNVVLLIPSLHQKCIIGSFSRNSTTITEKKFLQKIVKKNEFIDGHQESDYTGDRL
jgi:hypothetical protein